MNFGDSSFLCLDIGTSCVRAVASKVRAGHISKQIVTAFESSDTAFAIKSAVEEAERQIGAVFDSALVTGNFGPMHYRLVSKSEDFGREHKVIPVDIKKMLSDLGRNSDFAPMHIVPLRYDMFSARNVRSPIGITDKSMSGVFAVIEYERGQMAQVIKNLRTAHLHANGFFDPHFLIASLNDKPVMVVDFGAQFSSLSIWTVRGPVFAVKIEHGGADITRMISERFNIKKSEAERIKRSASSMTISDMDQFAPADPAHDFSRADLNDIVSSKMREIISDLRASAQDALGKYLPKEILVTGGGSGITGIEEIIFETFHAPVRNLGAFAAVNGAAQYAWSSVAHGANAYLAKRARWVQRFSFLAKIFTRKKKKARAVPVMPSTLSFDMSDRHTYDMFDSAGISAIHVDIMDGFFVDRVFGGIDSLRQMRAMTKAHLHVHLMTESPASWASAVLEAGADTVIISSGTAGAREALVKIKEAGKRCGVALNPETHESVLKSVLRDIDEVLVMSVNPGAGGQEFMPEALRKIRVLAATRKKYDLKFKISVDGGINPVTAKQSWDAGADLVVSGSYLAKSPDFRLAVRSLLRQ